MTGHHGQRYRVVTAPGVPVGSTHASGAYLNDGTVQGTVRVREVHQVDRAADRLIKECSHRIQATLDDQPDVLRAVLDGDNHVRAIRVLEDYWRVT